LSRSSLGLSITAADADSYGVSRIAQTTWASDRGLGGALFRPTSLAAGELMHVHSMQGNGDFLFAFRTSWMNATASGTGYSAYTTRLYPTLVQGNTLSGSSDLLTDRGQTPGMMHSTLVHPLTMNLIGGTSIGDRVVYLCSAEVGIDRPGLLSLYDTADNRLHFADERVLANTGSICWNRGIFEDAGYLYVIGAHLDTGSLHVRRKPTGTPLARGDWEYLSGMSGWSADAGVLSPLIDSQGNEIITAGPVSVGRDRTSTVLSTTRVEGSTAYAQLYLSRSFLLGFDPIPASVGLGDTVTGTFLGGGIRFQQSLPANPANADIADTSLVSSGIPYCTTIGSATNLTTVWRVWPIPKVGVPYEVGYVPEPVTVDWFADTTAPGTVAGATVGDRFVNTTTGDVSTLS
jgi:hypothetical protein